MKVQWSSGVMEYWNDGILEIGILEYWSNGVLE
jgi:hypothetical protein